MQYSTTTLNKATPRHPVESVIHEVKIKIYQMLVGELMKISMNGGGTIWINGLTSEILFSRLNDDATVGIPECEILDIASLINLVCVEKANRLKNRIQSGLVFSEGILMQYETESQPNFYLRQVAEMCCEVLLKEFEQFNNGQSKNGFMFNATRTITILKDGIQAHILETERMWGKLHGSSGRKILSLFDNIYLVFNYLANHDYLNKVKAEIIKNGYSAQLFSELDYAVVKTQETMDSVTEIHKPKYLSATRG